MKIGFSTNLYNVLADRGLLTPDVIGTVVGSRLYDLVKSFDPDVESGLDFPTYDYVVFSEKPSVDILTEALQKLNSGGIIIYMTEIEGTIINIIQKGLYTHEGKPERHSRVYP